MKTNNTETAERPSRAGDQLDKRYGAIGISAVAAAVRYQCDGKNLAYAPVVPANASRDDAEAA
jgi:hypothetical protein